MPKALPKATFQLAKALFLQGLPRAEVAKRCALKQGTVRTWSQRDQWGLLRRKAEQSLESREERVAVVSFSERSVAIRDKLASTLDTDAAHFANIPRRNGLQVLKLHAQAEPLVRNCAKVLGWEPGVSVQIGVIGADMDELTLDVGSVKESDK